MVALAVPPRYLSAADGVTGTFRVLVTKLASFLPSSENPDVVVLGSSLVLVPAVRCDDLIAGKTPCYDRWYYDRYIPEYTHSEYLQQKLSKLTGQNLTVKNLGVASSIMSDQYGIFKLMLAEGKRPKMLVLGLAPRDFLDNTQQKHLETPTRLFIHEYEDNSLLPQSLSISELQNSAGKIQRRFEKVVARIRTSSVNLACAISGHQSVAEYSSGQTYVGDRPNRLKDLETYRKLYNPPNFSMLAQQSKYLSRLLATARKNNIAVLVINMPLTRENTDTLDPAALVAYTNTLATISAHYGAGFLNIGSHSDQYSLKDFEDCCHLNVHGGEKFYAAMVSNLAADQKMLTALNKNGDAQAIAGHQSHGAL